MGYSVLALLSGRILVFFFFQITEIELKHLEKVSINNASRSFGCLIVVIAVTACGN